MAKSIADETTTTTTIPQVKSPQFSIESGTTFKSSIIVDLSCATKNAVIMYSFDNINWITGKIVVISETTTLYAKAKLNGMADSEVVSATYINTNISTTTTSTSAGLSTTTTNVYASTTTTATYVSSTSTSTNATATTAYVSTTTPSVTTTTNTSSTTIAPSSTTTTILTSTSTSSTSTTTTTTINGKEINIKFYEINVEDGTTDFNIGETVYGTPKDLVFTIENKGNQNIILSGTPTKVSLTGDCFSLKSDVGASIILPGNSTTFTVKFDPTYNADLDTEWSASIVIPNDDVNENPYNFTIKGKGVINPELRVEYNSSIISDNVTDYLLTFPNGFTNNLKFTIKNIGVGNLKLTGSPKIALSGSEFSLIQDAEEIIADGSYSEFIVKFSPTGSGTYTGNISIASNDVDNNPYNFSFKIVLEKFEPEINIKMNGINITDGSSSIDIGELLYDTTKDVTFAVENIGTADLYLIGNPIIGFSGSCLSLIDTIDNPVIVPSGSASFTIRFAPNVSNGSAEYIGTVSILNSDTDEDTYNWTIKGTSVINPEINVKDSADNIPDGTVNYDFGSVKYGETKDIVFTIENTGIGDILLTGSPRVAVSGTGFSLKSDATNIIGQGSSSTFTVTFTPPSSFGGNYSGSVSITNNDSNENPYNFSVIAVGLMNPEIGIKEGTNNIPNGTVDYDLGSTMYGTPKDITFTIENTGLSLLVLSGTPRVSVSGTGFTLKTDALANISVGASSSFIITFTPTADGGDYSGTVTINSNDVDESVYTYSIKATGLIAPEINVKCGGLNIEDGTTDVFAGGYMLNKASDITFIIENTGIGNLKFTGSPRVAVSGDFFSLKTDVENIVSQGSFSTFVLTFNPLYEGEYSCNVSINNNDPDENIHNFSIICRDLKCTITFDKNAADATGTMATQTIVSGLSANLTANGFSKSGCSFIGWAKTAGGAVAYADGASYSMGSANVTLYAKWTHNSLESLAKRELVSIDGGTYTQTDGTRSFSHTISAFSMGKYEVTYELWYTVYQWAISNGYILNNAGRPGSKGVEGAVPDSYSEKYNPVTYINWRDSIVWCNAYSEMSGLAPVYCTNAGFNTYLKTSTNSMNFEKTTGGQDNPYVNWSANGYRLPTEGEWQYAASYIDGTSWTPYNYLSGATSTNTTECARVATYSGTLWGHTTEVGYRDANDLGLYDMSGNVGEWVHDWNGSYPTTAKTNYKGAGSVSDTRIYRGGSWFHDAEHCQVGYRDSNGPWYEWDNIGLRVARGQ